MDEFITTKEIMEMFQCSVAKANKYKHLTHEATKERGITVLNNRTCLKSILLELFVTGTKGGKKSC